MKHKKIKTDNYDLHLIKTDKFKTITFLITFYDEIKKEEITCKRLLLDNLLFSSKEYPTEKIMSIKRQDLYGAKIGWGIERKGYNVEARMSINIINNKYTDKQNLEESMKLLREIIFNPNVENNKFNEEIFEITKRKLEQYIKEIKEDNRLYANYRMHELLNNDLPSSYRIDGYLEDLDKITPASLYKYYKQMIENSTIDIYVLGDFDEKEMGNLTKHIFNFKSKTKEISKKQIEHTPKKEILEISEDSEFNQSVLSVGCLINDYKDQEKYALGLYNLILGGTSRSKLFQNIREKNSLAYFVSSSIHQKDKFIQINAGISCKNYDLAVKIIKKEIKEMQKGNITDEEIKIAKEHYMTALKDFDTTPEKAITFYISYENKDVESIEKMKREINKITKKDIIKVSKKIKIDTIYLLKEGDNK